MVSWSGLLAGQLEFYWEAHLSPRLAGLTDEEYFWEPVEGCWNLRRGADGRYLRDVGLPPGERPETEPVTTIAWRLVHIGVDCLSSRTSAFFGPYSTLADADMFDPRHLPEGLPGSADEALTFLEGAFRGWHGGIAALDEDALAAPLGRRGGPYADDSMAALILHLNREIMHHGGEVGVLRDLYRATSGQRLTQSG